MENQKLSSVWKWIVSILLIVVGIGAIATMVVLQRMVKTGNLEEIAKWVYYVVEIPSAVLVFVGAFMIYGLVTNKHGFHSLSTPEITMIAVQSAITVVLYYFAKFSLPFFPGWLDIQVSELPALITTFAYGPYAGCMVILVRFLTKLPATITAGVGELSDLILGLILCIVSGLIYKKHHTLKGALAGTGIAMVSATFVACFTNWLILIPAYTVLAGLPMSALVGMLSYMGEVTEENFMMYYIFVGVIPFNLFRYAIVYILTFILYKRTHIILNKITAPRGLGHNKKAAENN